MRLGGGGQVFALGAAALLKWQTFREKYFKSTLQRRDLYSKRIAAKRREDFLCPLFFNCRDKSCSRTDSKEVGCDNVSEDQICQTRSAKEFRLLTNNPWALITKCKPKRTSV